jgi:nitrogen PTS system EIIA component
VLLCRDAVGFDAIDGLPVNIFFAVISPRREVGQHLKTLARVSRLLRDETFRKRLVDAKDGDSAFALIVGEESRPQ